MAMKNIISKGLVRLATSGFLVLGPAICVQGQDTNLNPDFQATQTAADKGDAQAQYKLAQCYAGGKGVRRNFAKAAHYLRLAADQNNSDAELALGSFYGRGWGVPRNLNLAIQWYCKAAEQGNPLAQYAMGNFYATGRGVTNDMNQAIKWWQKAADQKQVAAESALGELYLIPAAPYGTNYLNYPKAIGLLRQAMAQGSVHAMNNLGAAYEGGLGVERDFKEAARWYRAAAERGDALAQANLGQLYFDGRGVPFDLEQAYKWFKLSANQGNTRGLVGFGNFQSGRLLTPKQLAEAEQMVMQFQPLPSESRI
jgi:uncharacterized protein